MSSIYELTDEFISVMEMLEDEEIDEQTILDTLEGIEYEIEMKADGYAKMMKSLESKNKGIKDEIDRLTYRKSTFENRIDHLKKNLKMCMEAMGKKRITTDLFTFNIQKNGGKRKLTFDVPEENIPKEFKIPQPDKIDGDKIRDYLKENGLEGQDGSINAEWFHLEPQSESLRIK